MPTIGPIELLLLGLFVLVVLAITMYFRGRRR
jgi:uncharacterized membrane protein YvlD (DUF360 family)